jgi:hypothetical protein
VNNISGSNAGGTTNFQSPGQTGTFADPNHFINADGPNTFDYTNQVKLDGTYHVPALGGFNVSAVYRYTTGLAWGRTATIRGLSQGNETVRIEPRGTRRTDPINNLDFRAEKTFPSAPVARSVSPGYLQHQQPGRHRQRIANGVIEGLEARSATRTSGSAPYRAAWV